MAAENSRIMRVFKAKSPCGCGGGCWKRFQDGKCSEEDLRRCYASLSRLEQGEKQ
jgi:hypothetical protein